MAVLNPDQSKGTQPAVSGHNRNILSVLNVQTPVIGEPEDAPRMMCDPPGSPDTSVVDCAHRRIAHHLGETGR